MTDDENTQRSFLRNPWVIGIGSSLAASAIVAVVVWAFDGSDNGETDPFAACNKRSQTATAQYRLASASSGSAPTTVPAIDFDLAARVVTHFDEPRDEEFRTSLDVERGDVIQFSMVVQNPAATEREKPVVRGLKLRITVPWRQALRELTVSADARGDNTEPVEGFKQGDAVRLKAKLGRALWLTRFRNFQLQAATRDVETSDVDFPRRLVDIPTDRTTTRCTATTLDIILEPSLDGTLGPNEIVRVVGYADVESRSP